MVAMHLGKPPEGEEGEDAAKAEGPGPCSVQAPTACPACPKLSPATKETAIEHPTIKGVTVTIGDQ